MNIANKLTISRIVFSILILVLLLFPWSEIGFTFPTFLASGKIVVDLKYLIVAVLFLFASVTDYLDGYLARKDNIVSDFGACLDAIADKLLVNGLLIVLAYQGFISVLVPVLIVSRDICVDALKTLSAKDGVVVKASIWGKVKTIFMMIGILLLLCYNLPFELWNIHLDVICIYIATVLSIISGVIYYYDIRKPKKKTKAQ